MGVTEFRLEHSGGGKANKVSKFNSSAPTILAEPEADNPNN